MTAPVLEVRGLTTRFPLSGGEVRAVNGISFQVRPGETLGLVGESGCGKSVTALSLVGLVPPPGEVVAGEVRLGGRDLRGLAPAALREVRGSEVGMIFQDPMTALNPVLPVGRQVAEVLEAHTGVTRARAREEAVRLLGRVGIPDPGERAGWYPHALSGGQRQRIMIAAALACRPALLVADEPTTALDSTVQARIAELIGELQEETGMAVLWITHDLALAARVVDRVAVMYAGGIVEEGPRDGIFRRPAHPYTRALVAAARELAAGGEEGEGADGGAAPGSGQARRLTVLSGRPPDLLDLPLHCCAFAPRCPWATDLCREDRPPLRPAPRGHADHRAACWHLEEVARADAHTPGPESRP